MLLNLYVSGSFEMKKLKLAIMGQKGNNLNDLKSMDGKMFLKIYFEIIIFLK